MNTVHEYVIHLLYNKSKYQARIYNMLVANQEDKRESGKRINLSLEKETSYTCGTVFRSRLWGTKKSGLHTKRNPDPVNILFLLIPFQG